MRPVASLVLAAALAGAPGCGSDCEQLKADAEAARATWSPCTAGDVCVLLQAAGEDCTGQFGCAFAVNQDFEQEAVDEAARIADESTSCSECARADCAEAVDAYCAVEKDATSGVCTVLRQ
jgi:hypothetical protein